MLTLVLILGIGMFIVSKIVYFKRRKAIQGTKRKTESFFWEDLFPLLLLTLGIVWASGYGTLSAHTNTIFSRWMNGGEVATIYQRIENYEKTLGSQQDDEILESLKEEAKVTRFCEKMIYPKWILESITDELTK